MNSMIGLTVDCVDPDRVVEFWRRALALATVAAPSPEVRVIEVPLGEHALRLTFRRVSSPKFARNRVRLGLETADLENETARLIAHGAIRIDGSTAAGGRATLADVEGNEFELLGDAPT
jgi:predicted enzyme related to lactoylglutathione lyase